MKHASTDRLLTLGMALYADRRTMEQRVRGIFARVRSPLAARLAALMFALLLGVACFTTACVPEAAQGSEPTLSAPQTASPEAEPSETAPPTLAELQSAMDGEHIPFHSGSHDLAYTFVYAGEGAPLGDGQARDASATIDPRDAAIRAAKLLVAVYGGTCLTAPYTVSYLDDGQAGPLYFVTVENTRYQGEDYLAVIDAVSGQARYVCLLCAPHAESGKLKLTAAETDALTDWDEWKASSAGEWLRRLFADEYELSNVDWNAAPQPLPDSFQTAEPFIYGDGDVKCRMLLHMPEGESYDVAWLEDADDLSMSWGLLSAARIPAGGWETYRADDWEALIRQYLPAIEPWRVGERWIEAIDNGAAFVNADVTAQPDMPAKTVQLNPEPISQSRVDEIVAALAPGAALYAYRDGKTEERATARWRKNADGTSEISVWADILDNADMLFTGKSGPGGDWVTVTAIQPDNGAIGTILRHDQNVGRTTEERAAHIFGLTDIRQSDNAWTRDGQEHDTYTPAYGGIPALRAHGLDWLPNALWIDWRGHVGAVGAGFTNPCAYGAETPLEKPLLPLAEIQRAVREQILALSDGGVHTFRITALIQCFVPEYDAAARGYRLVPAWNVYGYDANASFDTYRRADETRTLLLTLRASDGMPLAAAERE